MFEGKYDYASTRNNFTQGNFRFPPNMYWRPSVLWDVKQRRSVVGCRRFGTRLLKSLRGNDRLSQIRR